MGVRRAGGSVNGMAWAAILLSLLPCSRGIIGRWAGDLAICRRSAALSSLALCGLKHSALSYGLLQILLSSIPLLRRAEERAEAFCKCCSSRACAETCGVGVLGSLFCFTLHFRHCLFTILFSCLCQTCWR